MKRVVKIALIAFAILFALAALAVVAGIVLLRGMQPLEDGTELADGAVVLIAGDVAASYIVKLANGDVALVDAGMDHEATAIRRALERHGYAPGDVTAIFLTHGHGDHIAGARAFPDAEIFVHQDDAALTEGRRVAGSLFARLQGREPAPTGIEVDHALTGGQVLTVGGTRVEIFALPGHTLGSAAYLIRGVLFVGDSAGARSDGKIAAAPPVFSADRAQNRQSLHRLAATLQDRSEDVDALAFGHQGPLESLDPLTTWSADHR